MLQEKLKILRLSGARETLDLRLQEASGNQLSHQVKRIASQFWGRAKLCTSFAPEDDVVYMDYDKLGREIKTTQGSIVTEKSFDNNER